MQTNFLVATNVIASSPAKVAKVKDEQAAIQAGFVWKTAARLNGGELFAYTVAVLSWLGALSGKSFVGAAFYGMYGSRSALTHHVRKGNIVEDGTLFRLTEAGIAHFRGREKGTTKGQVVQSKDARCLEIALKAGPSTKLATESAIVRAITWRKVGETK